MFGRKKQKYVDPVEKTVNIIISLVKGLSKADYNRLKKSMDLLWQGYQTARNVKTEDERENEDIDEIDRALTKEVEKKGGKDERTSRV